MKNDLVDIIQTFVGAFIGWFFIYFWMKSIVLVGEFIISGGVTQQVTLVVVVLSLITVIMSLE